LTDFHAAIRVVLPLVRDQGQFVCALGTPDRKATPEKGARGRASNRPANRRPPKRDEESMLPSVRSIYQQCDLA
jgi:hypothetical protein